MTREEMATLILTHMISANGVPKMVDGTYGHKDRVAKEAVDFADALIKALETPHEKTTR